MRKFTRAVTREIELGGERLALTLDETGVSVRPVGSRKAPATLTWSAAVCAATGKADLPAAVAALKGDGGAVAETEADGSPLGQALARLDAALRKHRPRFADSLEAGASAGDLAGLEKVLGRPLPPELRQWLCWHNGQEEEEIGAFHGAFNLLAAQEIAESYREQQEEGDPKWDANWIPILDDFQGDVLVLDPTEPGCPVREVWRGRDDHPVVAPTLLAWVDAFAREIEDGRFEEDPERGEYYRVEQ